MDTKKMETCIEACLDCYRSCVQTAQLCLTRGGKHAQESHITLLYDCASICRLSSDWMTRSSPRHHLSCRVCAEVCRDCARDCRRFADRDMDRCAEVCERCASACEEMAAAGAR